MKLSGIVLLVNFFFFCFGADLFGVELLVPSSGFSIFWWCFLILLFSFPVFASACANLKHFAFCTVNFFSDMLMAACSCVHAQSFFYFVLRTARFNPPMPPFLWPWLFWNHLYGKFDSAASCCQLSHLADVSVHWCLVLVCVIGHLLELCLHFSAIFVVAIEV